MLSNYVPAKILSEILSLRLSEDLLRYRCLKILCIVTKIIENLRRKRLHTNLQTSLFLQILI